MDDANGELIYTEGDIDKMNAFRIQRKIGDGTLNRISSHIDGMDDRIIGSIFDMDSLKGSKLMKSFSFNSSDFNENFENLAEVLKGMREKMGNDSIFSTLSLFQKPKFLIPEGSYIMINGQKLTPREARDKGYDVETFSPSDSKN